MNSKSKDTVIYEAVEGYNVEKFNLCAGCGCGNFALEVYKNNHPKYGEYWCVSCLECGCTMTGRTQKELLENWNADVFKEPEKEDLDSCKEYMEECICGASASGAHITKIQDKYHCFCSECDRHIKADTKKQMVLHWNDRNYNIPFVMIKRHEEKEREVARAREAARAERRHIDSAYMRPTRINPMSIVRAVEDEALRRKAKELSWEKHVWGWLTFEDQWTLDKAISRGLL